MKKKISSYSLLFIFSTTLMGSLVAPPKGWTIKKDLLRDRNHPAVRAFLDTIAYAEGTYHNRSRGYHMRFPSGTMFEDLDTHPGIAACALCGNKEISSTAAGRYMFLETIWKTVASRLDLGDFSPLNQDIAALYLVRERRALDDVKNGDLKSALEKVNVIWASLPGSPHQQPIKKYETLRKVFLTRYNHYKKYLLTKGMR